MGALTSKIHSFAFRGWKSQSRETREPLTPHLFPMVVESEPGFANLRMLPRNQNWLPDICRTIRWFGQRAEFSNFLLGRLGLALGADLSPFYSLSIYGEPGGLVSSLALSEGPLRRLANRTNYLPFSPFNSLFRPRSIFCPFKFSSLSLDLPRIGSVDRVLISPRFFWSGFRGGFGRGLDGRVKLVSPPTSSKNFPLGITGRLPYLMALSHVRVSPVRPALFFNLPGLFGPVSPCLNNSGVPERALVNFRLISNELCRRYLAKNPRPEVGSYAGSYYFFSHFLFREF